jgi:hypothetical protein
MNTFPVFRWKLVALAAAAILVLALTAIFFGRKPVVLVSDQPFNELYGKRRIRLEKRAVSFRFFRQVKTIEIAEGAGPDLVAQAAASLSRRPFAVFFPYRYREGARYYLKDRPGTVAVILGGRMRSEAAREESEPRWFYTDTAADLYRAGVLAGELDLRASLQGTFQERGAAALYQSGTSDAEKNAFSRGVQDQGWDGQLLVSSNNEPASRFLEKGIVCLTLLGRSDSRFFADPDFLILFSWADPALASEKIAAVFDDSPWAQLSPAIKLLKKGTSSPETPESGLIPSKLTILIQNSKQKMGKIAINRIKSLKYREENSENIR